MYADMCMKSEAQSPVVSFPCVSPKPCKISSTFSCPCIKNQCKCGRPPFEDNNSIPSFSIENWVMRYNIVWKSNHSVWMIM
jgi:hypothetical protein